MSYAAIKQKADALFSEAAYVSHINNQDDYNNALALMDELFDDYENQRLLIEVLACTIERWEDSAEEFSDFNSQLKSASSDLAILRLLMDQHGLTGSDLPEIGSKSLVSKVLSGKRSLTKLHIDRLARRFGISPVLFFDPGKNSVRSKQSS